jgi:hypothetical protein
MTKRPNRLFALLLAPAMLMLPADQALASGDRVPLESRVSTATSNLELERCLLTIHFLYEPNGQRFVDEGYLPEGYQPAQVADLRDPGAQLAARANIWAFNCANISVNGGNEAPGMLSLVAITIEDRPAHEHWAGISDFYLVWTHTNRTDIAKVIEAAGVPTDVVEGMTFDWRQGPLGPSEGPTDVRVPWPASPYQLGVRGLPGTNTPHTHDNTFQHADPRRGKSSLKLNVLLPPAQDLICLATGSQAGRDGWDGDPACGVRAEPGTEMARLLGDNPKTADFDPTTRTGGAVDHDMLWKATIAVHQSGS